MNRTTCLNKGWKFHLGDVENADYKGFDDTGWLPVTLPHDWSVAHPFDKSFSSGTGYLCGGIGWYRLRFTLPQELTEKHVRITFGGVYKNARVWCNSNYLGMRPSGYTSFGYDITDFAIPGENVLAVRVEHTDLADSRWFTGSGIYRDVTLTVLPRLHFLPDEVFISTRSASAANAELQVAWLLSAAGEAQFELRNAQGTPVAEARVQGTEGTATLSLPSPELWSPDHPYLYTLVCRTLEAGQVQDETCIPCGIRTFCFDPAHGFTLNGQALKFKGVCVHHDAGALGAAVPPIVWERRLRKLKAAGCNALRTSHNPPDVPLLDLCDQLGLLVMDEAFDEWEGCKNKWWQGHNVYPPKRFGYADAFPEWHERDLAAMVRRDRNHPSIVLWSIGNEIDYPNDPYVHPLFETMTGNNDANKPAAERAYDIHKPNANRLATIARELTAIVKQHDATRPVTSALAFPELSNLTGYAQELDVVGYNYKEHLYREDRIKYPNHVIYGSENGQTAEQWLAVRDHEDICGQFLWTGIDFLGECRGWPLRISQAGFMTLAGYEKPRYYHRQAMWSDALTVKIAASTTGEWHTERFVWDYEEPQRIHMNVYSNAEQVELFLNGRSLGIKKPGNAFCVAYEVPYEKGELRAVATRGGQSAEDALHTPSAATELQLDCDQTMLQANGTDVAQVEVSLRDSAGHLAASKDAMVHYALVGEGEILGIENGSPIDLTPYSSQKRATWNGQAIVYIRAGEHPGKLTLHATLAGCAPVTLALEQR